MGFFVRLVSLDLARGVLALLSLSAISVRYLFYSVSFNFCPFFYQVGSSRFVDFAPFQLLFLVVVC